MPEGYRVTSMDKSEATGLVGLERGRIREVREDGDGWVYKVESYTRDGILTRWIEAVGGEEMAQGTDVFYFMFADGRGLILGRARKDLK